MKQQNFIQYLYYPKHSGDFGQQHTLIFMENVRGRWIIVLISIVGSRLHEDGKEGNRKTAGRQRQNTIGALLYLQK